MNAVKIIIVSILASITFLLAICEADSLQAIVLSKAIALVVGAVTATLCVRYNEQGVFNNLFNED